jgi:hypothetical protein
MERIGAIVSRIAARLRPAHEEIPGSATDAAPIEENAATPAGDNPGVRGALDAAAKGTLRGRVERAGDGIEFATVGRGVGAGSLCAPRHGSAPNFIARRRGASGANSGCASQTAKGLSLIAWTKNRRPRAGML